MRYERTSHSLPWLFLEAWYRWIGETLSLSSSHLGNTGKRLSLSRPILPSYMLEPVTNHPAHLTFSVPTAAQTRDVRCRNINLLPIGYAFLPYLRSRLTPGGKSWPGKPWAYGEYVSHTFYRYSCQHLRLKPLHGVLSIPLHCCFNAPLPLLNE